MNYNPFSLIGKKLLITGASGGIGRAVACECSRSGAEVIITGRNLVRLDETFSLLEGEGHSKIIADLTVNDEVDKLIELLPSLDGVVHCTGIVKTVPFRFVSEADLKKIFEVNFFSSVTLSQKLVVVRKINRNGSIVFISSISGTLCSIPGNSMYSATKGAINGIVKGMALDLASSEIRVNSILPGMIDTGILTENIITREQIVEDVKRYPLKRYGKPEEVAWGSVYLLSDASSWITGSNLLIDGGYTLR